MGPGFLLFEQIHLDSIQIQMIYLVPTILTIQWKALKLQLETSLLYLLPVIQSVIKYVILPQKDDLSSLPKRLLGLLANLNPRVGPLAFKSCMRPFCSFLCLESRDGRI